MIEYVIDGSQKGLDQGIGIVRIKENTQECSSFYSKINNDMIGKHEENAIIKTLELIEKNEDKEVTIYNDSKSVVSRLKGGQPRKKQVMLRHIMSIVKGLRDKGYEINFAHMDKNGKRKPYKKAHELSRSYIRQAC